MPLFLTFIISTFIHTTQSYVYVFLCPHCFFAKQEEPGVLSIKLEPALQQADPLPTELPQTQMRVQRNTVECSVAHAV